MRLTYYIDGHFIDEETDEVIAPPAALHDVIADNEIVLADFFSTDLADAGIQGGIFKYWIAGEQGGLKIDFWLPAEVPESTIAQLTHYVETQLSDGAAESGFNIDLEGIALWVMPVEDAPLRTEQVDDGREVPPPHRIAICARDGQVVELEQAIRSSPERINEKLQGCSPLHLAILFGSIEAVRRLIDAGADVASIDAMGHKPVKSAVLSNGLNDKQSCVVVKMLVEAGADPHEIDPHTDWTLKHYAHDRNKAALVKMLDTF